MEEHANVLPLSHEEETIQLDRCSDLSADHQDPYFAHAFQDPFTRLLQSSNRDGYLVLNHSFQLQLYVELPIFKFFVDSVNRGQSGLQLLDYIH